MEFLEQSLERRREGSPKEFLEESLPAMPFLKQERDENSREIFR